MKREDRNGDGRDMSAESNMTDGPCESSPGDPENVGDLWGGGDGEMT